MELKKTPNYYPKIVKNRAGYRETRIKKFPEFIEIIKNEKDKREKRRKFADFIFRGQPEDLPLLPRLARKPEKLKGKIKRVERLIIDEFTRLSGPLSEWEPHDKWETLALAQHHGLPTRFLDWTSNALAAMWFAVKDPPNKREQKSQDGVIWVFMPEVKDYRKKKELYPYRIKLTKIYRPRAISRRIIAQSSVFTVHAILKDDHVIKFEHHLKYNKNLVKIIIPHAKFSEFRKELNILGINNSTLFPDLDGLASFLSWRFVKSDDE